MINLMINLMFLQITEIQKAYKYSFLCSLFKIVIL